MTGLAFLMSCVALAACAGPTAPGPDRIDDAPVLAQLGGADTVLVVGADTYVDGNRAGQNRAAGDEPVLRSREDGPLRALAAIPSDALAAAVGERALESARLELTISGTPDGWAAAGQGVKLHRMTVPWTEAGATWSCAIDADPTNTRADCGGETAWEMDPLGRHPWVPGATDSLAVVDGQSGVMAFDVTADIAAWLGGAVNAGWILRADFIAEAVALAVGANAVAGPSPSGARVDYGSRESQAPPRLVLTLGGGIAADTIWPVLTDDYPQLDTTKVLALSDEPETMVVFRTAITVEFNPGVSDSAKAEFFARHGMTVLGLVELGPGESGIFFVEMPDPGEDVQAYWDRISALQLEPEILTVVPVSRSGLRELIDARFPDDASTQRRTDWLNGSTSTWAMRAIRAPLAWGCETGDYGGAPVNVGLLEWKHQPTHPDLARSAPLLREPDDALLARAGIAPVSGLTVQDRERHAAATSGLLSASGDDSVGVAGAAWRTGLHLYAGYSSGNRPLPYDTGFYLLGGPIAADGLRVLSVSVDASFAPGYPADVRERAVQRLARTLRANLLDPLPDLLIVLASGNERFRGSVVDYVRSPAAAILRGALLLLREDPTYQDRIVVVAGTEQGNRFFDRSPHASNECSNVFTGVTDLAAPALDVTVLDRWSGQTGTAVPVTVAAGTSFSAPLVAGTAALLLSMDPTLSAAAVKDYLLRGAAHPRFRPETGLIEPPPEVQGLSGVHQLDAYGALTLLSHERTGTPICGVRAEVSEDGDGLVLERSGVPGGESLALPGAFHLDFPSVAQGGRRIAVTDGFDEFVKVFDHRGAFLHEVSGVQERQYLERDTADVTWEFGEEGLETRRSIRVRGPGRVPVTVDVGALVTNRPLRWTPGVRASMDGTRVAFDVLAEDLSSGAVTYGTFLVDADGSGLTAVERTDCVATDTGGCEELLFGFPAGIAWAQDSRTLTLTLPEFRSDPFLVRTRVRRVTAAGAPLDAATIADRETLWPVATADGFLLASFG